MLRPSAEMGVIVSARATVVRVLITAGLLSGSELRLSYLPFIPLGTKPPSELHQYLQ